MGTMTLGMYTAAEDVAKAVREYTVKHNELPSMATLAERLNTTDHVCYTILMEAIHSRYLPAEYREWIEHEVLESDVAGHYVYFISPVDSDMVKIGKAKSVEDRLMDLQIGNHLKLEVLCTVKTLESDAAKRLESRYHKVFADVREHGEWFRNPDISKVLGREYKDPVNLSDVERYLERVRS